MHDHVGKDEMNSSKAGSLAQMEFAIESGKEKSDPIFEIDTALEKQSVDSCTSGHLHLAVAN